jgi:3-oxoacyl-[acyl-carrier protein] reductase
MFSLEGKLALVTGASGGIGGAIASALFRNGASVVMTGRSEDKLNNVKESIYDKALENPGDLYHVYNKIYTLPMNLMDPEQSKTLVKTAADIGNAHIDILVNAAGAHQLKIFTKITREQLDNMMYLNFTVPFQLCQDAIVSMVQQKFGRIINITSCASHGTDGQSHYNASKGALEALTKSLASNYNYAQNGITVNAIAPGVINTDMTKIIRGRARELNLAMIPMGRFGTVDEVAGTAAFLASSAANYINAQVLHVDGGMVR